MIYKRNYRLSDVVAMICTPCALLLYLHLTLITHSMQRPLSELSNTRVSRENSDPDTGSQWRETTEFILSPKQTTLSLPLPPVHPFGPPLNVTGRGTADRLLYTPILQSGASSMKHLLGFLKKENHFKLITEPPQKTLVVHIEKDDVKARIVNKTSQLPGATALVHSFAYFEFDKYGGKQPIHISVVREPVDRAISLFYRVRAPYQVVERHTQFPELSLPKRSFLKKVRH
ncbi:hypothetical protein FHG87_015229 [Trinorchestia longiramus]|nr:hypothetical protein FHG87_015229 [Trinorchestia longiramus]